MTNLAVALAFLIIGDTQSWVETSGGAFERMARAACETPVDGVIFTGDMTDKNKDRQWDRVERALDVLDACGLPYYLLDGNHDDSKAYSRLFRSRPFQPLWQYELERVKEGKEPKQAPLYAEPLDRDWTLLGVPYNEKIKDEAADWVRSLPGRLIWLNHKCVSKHRPGSNKDCRFVGDVGIAISGHHNPRQRQFWEVRDGVVSVIHNTQDVPELKEWATLLTLAGPQVCFSAWNPTTGATSYPPADCKAKMRLTDNRSCEVRLSDCKIESPDEPECFYVE